MKIAFEINFKVLSESTKDTINFILRASTVHLKSDIVSHLILLYLPKYFSKRIRFKNLSCANINVFNYVIKIKSQ